MGVRADWVKHFKNWQHSGMTQAAYYRQQGLNDHSFTVRLSVHRKNAKSTKSSKPISTSESHPVLIPVWVWVRVQASPPSMANFRLTTRQGYQLELPVSMSASWVAELLRCLD